MISFDSLTPGMKLKSFAVANFGFGFTGCLTIDTVTRDWAVARDEKNQPYLIRPDLSIYPQGPDPIPLNE